MDSEVYQTVILASSDRNKERPQLVMYTSSEEDELCSPPTVMGGEGDGHDAQLEISVRKDEDKQCLEIIVNNSNEDEQCSQHSAKGPRDDADGDCSQPLSSCESKEHPEEYGMNASSDTDKQCPLQVAIASSEGGERPQYAMNVSSAESEDKLCPLQAPVASSDAGEEYPQVVLNACIDKGNERPQPEISDCSDGKQVTVDNSYEEQESPQAIVMGVSSDKSCSPPVTSDEKEQLSETVVMLSSGRDQPGTEQKLSSVEDKDCPQPVVMENGGDDDDEERLPEPEESAGDQNCLQSILMETSDDDEDKQHYDRVAKERPQSVTSTRDDDEERQPEPVETLSSNTQPMMMELETSDEEEHHSVNTLTLSNKERPQPVMMFNRCDDDILSVCCDEEIAELNRGLVEAPETSSSLGVENAERKERYV